MKKFLIGCGIVTLLLICLVVGVVIFGAVKINKYGKGLEAAGKRIETVEKQFPFTAPSDQIVAEDRLQVYLTARDQMHDSLMDLAFIREMATAVDENRQPNIGGGAVMGLITGLPKLMDGVGTVLENNEMSASEYGFIGRQMLAASMQSERVEGEPASEVWNEIEKAIDSGQLGGRQQGQNVDIRYEVERLHREYVPEENMELAQEYSEELAPSRSVMVIELIFSAIMRDASTGMKAGQRGRAESTVVIDTAEELEDTGS